MYQFDTSNRLLEGAGLQNLLIRFQIINSQMLHGLIVFACAGCVAPMRSQKTKQIHVRLLAV